jgi:hypothetical protein
VATLASIETRQCDRVFNESLWKLRCEVVHESEGAEQRLEHAIGLV